MNEECFKEFTSAMGNLEYFDLLSSELQHTKDPEDVRAEIREFLKANNLYTPVITELEDRFLKLDAEAEVAIQDQLLRETLERFADCECAARFIDPRLPEWAKVRTTESTQAAPHKITDIRVRR